MEYCRAIKKNEVECINIEIQKGYTVERLKQITTLKMNWKNYSVSNLHFRITMVLSS